MKTKETAKAAGFIQVQVQEQQVLQLRLHLSGFEFLLGTSQDVPQPLQNAFAFLTSAADPRMQSCS